MNDAITASKHGYNTQRYNLFVTDRPQTNRYGWNSIPYRDNQMENLKNKGFSKIGFF